MSLPFVDPNVVETTYRVLLWAAPGAGKTVAACSAPGPIVVLSADRPSAYKFARQYHAGKEIREYRWEGIQSFQAVWQYLFGPDGRDVKTVIVDPLSNVIDAIATAAPKASDGGTDYQWVNSTLMEFLKELRRLDVHVVLIAHEKLNDNKKFGDGKLYPACGGAGLINKVLGEMDVVAHVERGERPDGHGGTETVWGAQLQPTEHLVCKEATGTLGDRRIVDLTEWFDVANGVAA
jgi:hypothetical protein